MTFKNALEENNKINYVLKEERLVNALYTLYGEKDALIKRLITFHKLKEHQAIESLDNLLFRILDDNEEFTWYEKTFMKIIISEVDFYTNVISPINNEFVIFIYCRVGKRRLFKKTLSADKLLAYIEKPINFC